MAFNKKEFLSSLESMTVMELNSLVKAIEEKFGVSAQAVSTTVQTDGPTPEVKVQEQTEFNVMLIDMGLKKVDVIKVTRELTQLGLVESKRLVESAPVAIREGLNKVDAEAAKKRLEDAGAKVELQ